MESSPVPGVYKVPYPPPRKFMKSVGEEYQVMKRGREYHVCWEEFNVEKKENGKHYHLPLILRLFGRISSGEKRKWKKIKI